MTPIEEFSETLPRIIPSMAVETPSRQKSNHSSLQSSPFQDVIDASPAKPLAKPTGPPVKDAVCNPMDEVVRTQILNNIRHANWRGYFSFQDKTSRRIESLQKQAKSMNGKKDITLSVENSLSLGKSEYSMRRKLGQGAFAPVYLMEDRSNGSLVAVKTEKPASKWEFFFTRRAKDLLGVSRPSLSIINVHSMYHYRDESFLLLEYRNQGTVLDLVNHAMSGSSNGLLDETLVAFLAIDLLRTVESLHAKQMLHGDLKPDNCMVRFDPVPDDEWSRDYNRDGTGGWDKKGISLIDFGRGIDLTQFIPTVAFIADWETDEQDCPEMRQARPWTYQVDYQGLASIIHSLLFGKYIKTDARASQTMPGLRKQYRLVESFKRYWQVDIWRDLFEMLLNPVMIAGDEGMPITSRLRDCRERLETWLESAYDKGVGLKALISREEARMQRA